MALPTSTLIWRVRPGGDDLGGGGFVSGGGGVDRSQQDEAQASGTNLTVDASVNTDVTPDGHTPDAADVNNIVQISAGASWTTGFYQIVSIQSGKWRLDRSPGATSLTGGVWSLGGGLASPGKAGAGFVGGNTIRIASGEYDITSTTGNVSGGRLVLPSNGSAAGLWNSVLGESPLSRPTLRWAVNAGNTAIIHSEYTNHRIEDLIFDGQRASYTGTYGIVINNHRMLLKNCKFMSLGFAFRGDCTYSHCTDLEVTNCAGVSFLAGGTFVDCNFHDNATSATAGAFTGNTMFSFDRCVFDTDATGRACYYGNSSVFTFRSCLFYNYPGNAFWPNGATNAILDVENCIFEKITGYAVQGSADARAIVMLRNNAYYDCSLGFNTGTIALEEGTIAGTQSFFVDAVNKDFNINNIAGGGALLRAATKVLAA